MATNFDVMAILRSELDMDSIDTVLDLGCGSFYNSPYDYETTDILLNIFGGKDIHAIDIYKPNIDWRKQYGPPGTYEQLDVMDFEFSKKYDLIICHHVLEHLTQEDHDKLLANIEKSFNKYSILGGPVGYHDNIIHENITGNPNEKHIIGLDPKVYEQLGYKMFYVSPVFVAIKKLD